jgi:hypothetical protein
LTTSSVMLLSAAAQASDEEAQWWVLLIVFGSLFVFFIALIAGRKRRPVPASDEMAGRTTSARVGYAEARWLSDNLTEPLAIWHGDADFEERDDRGATDAANEQIWSQLEARRKKAGDELYALEAAAQAGSPVARSAQRTVAALDATYAAASERSDARRAYRAAADSSDASILRAARDREVRASSKLDAARDELAAALGELAAVT